MNLCESSDDDSPQSKLYTVKSKGKKKRNKKSSEVQILFHFEVSSSLHDNMKGDVDEEEDLCAVPPHIMRIMQVQNMNKILIIIMVVINVMITEEILKSDILF